MEMQYLVNRIYTHVVMKCDSMWDRFKLIYTVVYSIYIIFMYKMFLHDS
jgi:hypothetical protein